MTVEQSTQMTDALIAEVNTVFGPDAVSAANDRAYDTALPAADGNAAEWLRVFTEAFAAELRRLLRPH